MSEEDEIRAILNGNALPPGSQTQMDEEDEIRAILSQNRQRPQLMSEEDEIRAILSQNRQRPQFENIPFLSPDDDRNWAKFLGQHLIKGTLNIADLGELIGKFGGTLDPSGKPISQTAKEAFREAGWGDLDSQGEGNTPLEKMLANAAQWVGGALIPIPGAGTLKNMGKAALVSAPLGAASSGMQQLGVNPLAADLTAALAGPKIGSSIANKFKSPTERPLRPRETYVANILQENMEPANLQKAIQNLENAPQYTITNYQPLTAEIANEEALAQIHRLRQEVVGSGIAAKNSEGRNAIGQVFDSHTLNPMREDTIKETVKDALKARKAAREAATEKGYDEIFKTHDLLEPKHFNEFLELPYAGETKELLEKYKRQLQAQMPKLSKKDIEYKKLYDTASESVKAQMPPPKGQGVPISFLAEIDKELGQKVKTLGKHGKDYSATILEKANQALNKDLESIKLYTDTRAKYAELSKPVDEILEHAFLKKLPNSELQNVIEKIFTNSEKMSSVGNINQLKKVITNEKSWQGVQEGIIKYIEKNISNAAAQGKYKELSHQKLENFFNNHEKALKAALTPEQFDFLAEVKKIVAGQNQANTLGKGQGSPSTGRIISALNLDDSITSNIIKGGAGVIAKYTAKYINPMVYNFMKYSMKYKKKQAWKVMDAALKDPKFAHKLLTHKFANQTNFNNFIGQYLAKSANFVEKNARMAPVIARNTHHNEEKD